MGKVYDDWERVVEAVLRREKLRQLCYAHSRSSSDSSSQLDGGGGPTSSLHLQAKMAMARLQEELIHTLTQNKQCFEHGYEESTLLVKPYSGQSSSSETEEFVLDLLDLDMIPQIKAIADIMFATDYHQEFCDAFARFMRGAFAVCLAFLDVEELSFDDIVQMEWKYLNSKIKKWRFAINNFIGVYLANAKLIFDQVMGEYGHVSSSCMIEASKPSLMCFLNFGCAVAVRPHQPERLLFCLLDMYEDLVPLIPSLEALFPGEIGSRLRVELHNLLTRLQDYANISMMLGKAIRPVSSARPFPDGGVHPLTRHVLSYILSYADYDHTFNLILKEKEEGDLKESISDAVAAHLHSITSALEANLANRSDSYNDTSLKHIFMANNIHHMVEEINNSKIKAYFGEEWIKRQAMKVRFHALSYERSTWSSILPLLRYDCIADRATAEARGRDFTVAFENVYEKQTRWCVPNRELRQELRISASVNVVRAYRDFFKITIQLFGDKHIKYSEHELETLVQDLFGGSSSHTFMNCWRKGPETLNFYPYS